MGRVLGRFEMLVLLDGSTEVDGEVGVDGFVDRVGVRGMGLEDVELFGGKWWTPIVHGYGFKGPGNNRKPFTVCSGDFRMVALDVVREEGGYDLVVVVGIEYLDLIIVAREGIVRIPSWAGVCTAGGVGPWCVGRRRRPLVVEQLVVVAAVGVGVAP